MGVIYFYGVSCFWRIVFIFGKIIFVIFIFFSVENYFGCVYDYFQVYDGFSVIVYKIGMYCGYIFFLFINIIQYQMYIWFYSDQFIFLDGFLFNWIFVDLGEYNWVIIKICSFLCQC